MCASRAISKTARPRLDLISISRSIAHDLGGHLPKVGGADSPPEVRRMICIICIQREASVRVPRANEERATHRLRSSIKRSDETEDEQRSIEDLLLASGGAGFVVEHGGCVMRRGDGGRVSEERQGWKSRMQGRERRTVAEAEGDAVPIRRWRSAMKREDEGRGKERHNSPSQRPNQTDKLIQIARSRPRNSTTPNNNKHPKHVLLPLDLGAMLARAREDAIFHNSDGGEELERGGEEDGDRVEKLGGVDEFVVLREVDEDDGLLRINLSSAISLSARCKRTPPCTPAAAPPSSPECPFRT